MIGELTNNILVQKILIVVLITLLPLVPAFILFKFLPSKSIVSGPFKGLNVDFSGATAIYFIIFITIFGASQFWNLEEKETLDPLAYEVWKVEGKLRSANVQDFRNENLQFKLNPSVTLEQDGSFSTYIVSLRDQLTEEMNFPFLHIEDRLGKYRTHDINLDKNNNDPSGGYYYDIEKIDSLSKIIIGAIDLEESGEENY